MLALSFHLSAAGGWSAPPAPGIADLFGALYHAAGPVAKNSRSLGVVQPEGELGAARRCTVLHPPTELDA